MTAERDFKCCGNTGKGLTPGGEESILRKFALDTGTTLSQKLSSRLSNGLKSEELCFSPTLSPTDAFILFKFQD